MKAVAHPRRTAAVPARLIAAALVVVIAAAACSGKKADQASPAPNAAVVPAPTTVSADRSHDLAGCADPTWAPARIVGFSIGGCTDKAWATRQVFLTQGPKILAGRRITVTYDLQDPAQNPHAVAARMAIVQQALKAGAQLMSNPAQGYNAVLTQKTPQGEFWYVYDHGSGNETSTSSYTLTTVQILPLPQAVQARPVTAPLDATNHACQDPPWLVKQFAFFKVDTCEAKAWDVVDVQLPQGGRSLQGVRTTVNYTLTDEKQSPAALAVTQNYINALQAIGAKMVSDPNDGYRAVLTQATPVGELWYIYAHGSGNEDDTSGYSLTTIAIRPLPQEVLAQPFKGPLAPKDKTCANPPWLVRQFTYFNITGCNYRDFDQVDVVLPSGKQSLAGHVLTTDFTLTDPAQDPAALAVKTNYVNALQAIGARLVSDPNDGYRAVLTQKTDQGELWYIYSHGNGNAESTGSYELVTVQIGGPTPKACTLEVYGVNFDFDKSDLRPDSEPVLQQLLALFNGDPQYVAEVGGHTDNIGQSGYNLKLSDARAGAVRQWLIAHGVAQARLTARGYGDTRPLVPNTTDDNRAKNRRVELKRANCKP